MRPPTTPVVQPEQPLVLPSFQQEVPLYELTMPKETLTRFHQDVWTSDRPATLTVEGKSWPVEVRLRGRSARFWDKKSWRIELPDGQAVDGQRKLKLIAMVQDQTMLVEKLAYDLLAALGAPAPRAKFVRLNINGQYEGVFLQLEHVGKRFLKRNGFVDSNADIYRCGSHDCEMKLFRQSYQGPWVKKSNESEPSDGLDALLGAINRTPEPQFAQVLEGQLDVQHLLSALTVDALMSNYTVEDSGSYLIFDRYTRRWTYVPWDYNNANSRFWPTYGLDAKPLVDHPLVIFSLQDDWVAKRHQTRLGRPEFPDYLPAFSNLNTRVALNPALRERLLQRIDRALEELFLEEPMNARIEAIHALIDPYMKDDPYMDYARFTAGRKYIRDYVRRRIPFLRAELERLRRPRAALVIDAFDPAAGWIELRNRSDAPASTSGLVITNDLRRALRRNVPGRSLAPGARTRFSASELGLTFPREGEVGLFDGQSVTGALDALFYGELPAGQLYARDAGAPGDWELRAAD